MKNQFDINDILDSGRISNELDYERALISDRKLRILARENPRLKSVRNKLRELIVRYEATHWSGMSTIDNNKLADSEIAMLIAEEERQFIQRRKMLIKQKLKILNLNQEKLMTILGHKSKSYMSELINGIYPFTLNDLVVIHQLLKIELKELIPTTISLEQIKRIQKALPTT